MIKYGDVHEYICNNCGDLIEVPDGVQLEDFVKVGSIADSGCSHKWRKLDGDSEQEEDESLRAERPIRLTGL